MEQDVFVLPQMFNERRTANILDVSVAALRRWRREQRGPEVIYIEGCVRYSSESIQRYLQENSSANKNAADSRSAAQREVRGGHATART